jgi:hypothetical protein
MSSVTAQSDGNEPNDPEGRKLPSAIRVGEEKASRSVHGEYGSKQYGNECYGGDPREEASDQRNASRNFNRYCQIGKRRGEPKAPKELSRSSRREHEDLETRVCEKQNAERYAQDEDGVWGSAQVNQHNLLLACGPRPVAEALG